MITEVISQEACLCLTDFWTVIQALAIPSSTRSLRQARIENNLFIYLFNAHAIYGKHVSLILTTMTATQLKCTQPLVAVPPCRPAEVL